MDGLGLEWGGLDMTDSALDFDVLSPSSPLLWAQPPPPSPPPPLILPLPQDEGLQPPPDPAPSPPDAIPRSPASSSRSSTTNTKAAATPPSPTPLRRVRILLVDSYVAHAAHIRRVWEQETRPLLLPVGLLPVFDVVQDGLEAMALLQSRRYELVLLSSALKDVAALELARAVAHQLRLPATLAYVTPPGPLDDEKVRIKCWWEGDKWNRNAGGAAGEERSELIGDT